MQHVQDNDFSGTAKFPNISPTLHDTPVPSCHYPRNCYDKHASKHWHNPHCNEMEPDDYLSGSGRSSNRVPAPSSHHHQETDSLTGKCHYQQGASYVVDTCSYTGSDPVTDTTATFTPYFSITRSKRVSPPSTNGS